jgi:hypothetical protein
MCLGHLHPRSLTRHLSPGHTMCAAARKDKGGRFVPNHNVATKVWQFILCLVFVTLKSCHTLLSMWSTCHWADFLPTFATYCGFQILSHIFVAFTLAKLGIGKVLLGTKQTKDTAGFRFIHSILWDLSHIWKICLFLIEIEFPLDRVFFVFGEWNIDSREVFAYLKSVSSYVIL